MKINNFDIISFFKRLLLLFLLIVVPFISYSQKTGKMNEPYHPFKSEKAKTKYLDYYDKRAETWTVSSENKYIETTYGKTYLRISGSENKPPLVLLHGDSENSLYWFRQIEEFSKHYRTYVIDNIYDNGCSIYYKDLKEPDDYVKYLDELFDSLELRNNINLVGFSYGGWLTSIYALSHPERLNKVVLISPSATVLQPRTGYLIRGISAHVFPCRYLAKKIVYYERNGLIAQGEKGRAIADQMIEDLVLAGKCFKKRKFVRPTVLTDSDFQNIKVPILFLVGENEVLYSAQKAVKRIKHIPHVKAEIIPNASHCITLSQYKILNKKVLDFLQKK